jgi:hypothetical protein
MISVGMPRPLDVESSRLHRASPYALSPSSPGPPEAVLPQLAQLHDQLPRFHQRGNCPYLIDVAQIQAGAEKGGLYEQGYVPEVQAACAVQQRGYVPAERGALSWQGYVLGLRAVCVA